jgi:sn-glycerol 3-phosphate transport system substrate-binding protein
MQGERVRKEGPDDGAFGRSRLAAFGRRAFLSGSAALLGIGCQEPYPRGREIVPLWFTYGGKNREVLEALVRRFNASQERDYVHPVYQGDYFEGLAKLRTALAAGAAPPLSHVVGEIVPYLAEAGVLAPLGHDEEVSRFEIVPELGQAGSFIGGAEHPLYLLPFNRSTPIAYLNGAVFERAGLAAPRTWSELRETARALTVRRGGTVERFGFSCPIDWWFWTALVGQAGGDVVEPTGRVSLGGEAGVEALELWRTLVLTDKTMKPPPGRDYNAWQKTNQDFLAGQVAMIWTSTAFLRYLEDNARFPVVAAPLPRAARFAVPTGGTHWVILKSAPSKQREAAFRFLGFMQETAQVIAWSTATGYLPVTRPAVAELERTGYYAKHPNDRVALDQLDHARPWPWSAELFRVQREIVQPKLELAVLSDRPAREVLDGARALASRSSG